MSKDRNFSKSCDKTACEMAAVHIKTGFSIILQHIAEDSSSVLSDIAARAERAREAALSVCQAACQGEIDD